MGVLIVLIHFLFNEMAFLEHQNTLSKLATDILTIVKGNSVNVSHILSVLVPSTAKKA